MATASVLFGLALVSACGSDSDATPAPDATGGAAGAPDAPAQPRPCGGLVCDPVLLPLDLPDIEACCPTAGGCGLDATPLAELGVQFEDVCQQRDQPGALDPSCPDSTPSEVPNFGSVQFAGCCTAQGRCGYMLDDVRNLITLGLGCVDSTPFLEAGVAADCGQGGGGAGGAAAGGAG